MRVGIQGANFLNGHTTQDEYLRRLGERVREIRKHRGVTRKFLAAVSGVSERYLAQLEAGEANVSVLLLREIANALNLTAEELISEPNNYDPAITKVTQLLRTLSTEQLTDAGHLLSQHFSPAHREQSRIALLGLRGAGKSTVGAILAKKLNVPFIELDRQIEQAAGVEIGMIMDLYGLTGFRRLERQCLDDVLRRFPSFVMATSGSLVSEKMTYDHLRATCHTVWLRATPEEHMQRVIEQGDMRPMGNNAQAMDDLKRILADREPLYAKANSVHITTGGKPEEIACAIFVELHQPKAAAH
jgi:XRE family transcriptional regulator, aerobic/anaerobic benzoate catabolism transcriptional regulator